MKKNRKTAYKKVEELKKILTGKYLLDCGHKVTFKHNFSNNVVIINYKNEVKIICMDCYD
ncbi:MAG: hypothetical protein A2452_11135 [Candidatus Firestonebacteria bacterium RIFOXYC2_FULL_39_67]|nr:MAG: hypothetical protein A2452_11135 [Candidatus Firestonebacteria bacterium RIFOXYC2_FULL_39_67]